MMSHSPSSHAHAAAAAGRAELSDASAELTHVSQQLHVYEVQLQQQQANGGGGGGGASPGGGGFEGDAGGGGAASPRSPAAENGGGGGGAQLVRQKELLGAALRMFSGLGTPADEQLAVLEQARGEKRRSVLPAVACVCSCSGDRCAQTDAGWAVVGV